MTQSIDEKSAVFNLVFLYDLYVLNIEAHIPDALKNYPITQEQLDAHCPSLDQRSQEIAKHACWYAYASMSKNPTQFEFHQNILPNSLEKVSENIKPKIHQTVRLDLLRDVIRIRSVNITKVDKGRQIR